MKRCGTSADDAPACNGRRPLVPHLDNPALVQRGFRSACCSSAPAAWDCGTASARSPLASSPAGWSSPPPASACWWWWCFAPAKGAAGGPAARPSPPLNPAWSHLDSAAGSGSRGRSGAGRCCCGGEQRGRDGGRSHGPSWKTRRGLKRTRTVMSSRVSSGVWRTEELPPG